MRDTKIRGRCRNYGSRAARGRGFRLVSPFPRSNLAQRLRFSQSPVRHGSADHIDMVVELAISRNEPGTTTPCACSHPTVPRDRRSNDVLAQSATGMRGVSGDNRRRHRSLAVDESAATRLIAPSCATFGPCLIRTHVPRASRCAYPSVIGRTGRDR